MNAILVQLFRRLPGLARVWARRHRFVIAESMDRETMELCLAALERSGAPA